MKLVAKGFDELAKRLGQNRVRQPFFRAIRNVVLAIQIAAKHGAPVGATGDLKRSITTQLDQTNLKGVVGFDRPGSQYAKHVEFGAGPHWVPIRALARWASQRGLNPFAVQRSIAQKGTKPHPFFFEAYRRNKSYVSQQFQNALKEAKRAH